MKTKQLIVTALLLMIISVVAHADNFSVSRFSINGLVVEIPVKLEEAIDSIPSEISVALATEKETERKSLVSTQFDISRMARPEQEADDVSIDTRAIFQELIGISGRPVRCRATYSVSRGMQ